VALAEPAVWAAVAVKLERPEPADSVEQQAPPELAAQAAWEDSPELVVLVAMAALELL